MIFVLHTAEKPYVWTGYPATIVEAKGSGTSTSKLSFPHFWIEARGCILVRYWNPANTSLSKQIDRMFDDFMGLHEAKNVTTWTPAVELIEKEDAFLLTYYLPGVSADETDVQVTQESVSITGLRKKNDLAEGERSLYSDVAYGQFRRFVQLPARIQNTKVDAEFNNGILFLTLPKVEEEKNKVVKLSLGQSTKSIEESNTAADASES